MLVEQVKKRLLNGKIRNGIVKKIKFGPFVISYHRNRRLNMLLPFPPGIESLENNIDTLKYEHYMIRDELDEQKKKAMLSALYEEKLKKTPDLDNPRTLTEKINWLKLHYFNPDVTICCDKFKVKEFVEDSLGTDLCVRTLQSWKNSSDIDFDSLPERFVLKVNWSSGYNIFVTDKSALSEAEKKLIIKQLEIWTRPYSNSYYDSFNWGYKNIEAVIYAEEMLDEAFTRYEYKVFCFNGKPEFTLIENDPNGANPKRVCVDCKGNRLPFCFGTQAPSEEYQIFDCYKKILDISKELSATFPFVRIDFLATEKKFYLGEMTFYSGGGFSKVTPEGWDLKLGEYLSLQKRKEEI